MISYLLVVEQHRTQIVIHALLKCQQENLYHEQNVTQDRKSGSAGMPRPISYAVFCLKKKKDEGEKSAIACETDCRISGTIFHKAHHELRCKMRCICCSDGIDTNKQ